MVEVNYVKLLGSLQTIGIPQGSMLGAIFY